MKVVIVTVRVKLFVCFMLRLPQQVCSANSALNSWAQNLCHICYESSNRHRQSQVICVFYEDEVTFYWISAPTWPYNPYQNWTSLPNGVDSEKAV